MGFTTIFGGTPTAPASPAYEPLTLSANVTLVWPTEAVPGVPYVAGAIDVNPTVGGLSLLMPDARQGVPGVAALIANVGSAAFTLADNTGTPIVTINTTQQYVVVLTSNTTQAGTWRVYQLAATTATATAAALAGAGLQANGSLLQVFLSVVALSANTSLTAATYRAKAIDWTGAAGTLTFDTAANMTNGWFCFIVNAGSGALTLAPSGGATINGQSTVVLPQSAGGQFYSAVVVCDGTNLLAFGLIPSPIPITGGGTGANTGTGALTNFGGTATGIALFTAANAAAAVAVLGLSTTTFSEITASTNQTLTSSSAGTALICTAALNVNLPVTTAVTTKFYFGVNAQGGNVTLVPGVGTDAINGGTAGANFTLQKGQSAIFVTDANGNWWPLVLAGASSGGGGAGSGSWAIAGGAADAITVVYSPPNTALVDGMVLSFRAINANATAAPTFSPDGLGAHPITKFGGAALLPGDIAGNLAEVTLRYNLANTRWELLDPMVLSPPWVVAGGAADAITAAYSPAIKTLYDGLLLTFRAIAANATTTPTFSPNGLTAHTITKGGGLPVNVGDIPGNLAECIVRYNLSNTRWELLNPSGGAGGGSAAGISGIYRNLKMTAAGGTTTVVITADAVVVGTASDASVVTLEGLSKTLDLSASGANGLDTGAIAPSTQYFIFAIWNGATQAVLGSLSPTAPTMPGGYTFKARIGALFTDGSSKVFAGAWFGNKFRYATPRNIANGTTGVINVTTFTPSAQSIAAFVPSTAAKHTLLLQNDFNAAGTSTQIGVAPNTNYGPPNSNAPTPPVPLYLNTPGTGVGTIGVLQGDLFYESSNIQWACNTSGGAIWSAGWEDNL